MYVVRIRKEVRRYIFTVQINWMSQSHWAMRLLFAFDKEALQQNKMQNNKEIINIHERTI